MNQKLLPEWIEQSGVMLTWPHKHGWTELLDEADQTFTEIAKVITLYEKILISHYDAAHKAYILKLLENENIDLTKVNFAKAKSNDIWVRDNGPLTVQMENGSLKLLSFSFNAWGGKYPHKDDANLCTTVYKQEFFGNNPMELVDFVLEGCAIEVDGNGSLLTTESVMLNGGRNNLARADIEKVLKREFGVDRILWLKSGGLLGDDTDGHIDTLARFLDGETICYVSCDDPTDKQYEGLKDMKRELHAMRTLDGKPYRLIALPLPDPQFSPAGLRLPATYANFFLINGALLMPIYGAQQDAEAVHTIKSYATERTVHAVNCRTLIHFYGSLHCATMQLPKGVLS
ncbi:MAG: agmatine deiminase family protein [Parachlamydiaceae bacterium]|nr:agmatine deiminase family protein [Parachlamydiaceae bacterium]